MTSMKEISIIASNPDEIRFLQKDVIRWIEEKPETKSNDQMAEAAGVESAFVADLSIDTERWRSTHSKTGRQSSDEQDLPDTRLIQEAMP
ncbi:MAG: hypothetical protein GY866_04095 [Proteobacteria bacterium]|nr:hypothetical protein [Pseudomonadota bacterium]